MKKAFKLIVALGLVVSLCVSGVAALMPDSTISGPTPASFAQPSGGMPSEVVQTKTLLRPRPLQHLALTDELAEFAAESFDDFLAVAVDQLVARNTVFTVQFNCTYAEYAYIFDETDNIFNDFYSYDLPYTLSDLDYMKRQLKEFTLYGEWNEEYLLVTFVVGYWTTKEQEDYVDETVDLILEDLDVYAASQYEKIKKVHDYIIAHVEYDNDYLRYTAYDALHDGLAVCQGYALLTYRMLIELNVPVRYISGLTEYNDPTSRHGWNIVKIGSVWYNFDATWDDGSNSVKYFLKSNRSFPEHYREDEFLTDAFNDAHPMSLTDYSSSKDYTFVYELSLPFSSVELEVGDSFDFVPSITPSDATDDDLSISQTDTTIVSLGGGISGGVIVTALAPGETVVTAKATDGSGATVSCNVRVYDVQPLHDWGEGPVTALRERGVVPPDLLVGAQEAITRAQFTALMVQIYEYAKGVYTLQDPSPFTDIADNKYALEIEKAYELGLANGVGDNLFSPNGTLTREQCAKLVGTIAGIINETPVESDIELPYGDVDAIQSWALVYVRYALEYGLMNGMGVDFAPSATLTREQALVIAERMIEKYSW